MKNKSFDSRIHKSGAEFRGATNKNISIKKLGKRLTIKDVFYQSVNFRLKELSTDIL